MTTPPARSSCWFAEVSLVGVLHHDAVGGRLATWGALRELVAQQSTSANRAGAAVGVVVLVAIVIGFIALGVVNARNGRRLAAADAEISRLRRELAVASARARAASNAVAPMPLDAAARSGAPVLRPTTAYPLSAPIAADWYEDPRGQHQFRYWDGTAWTTFVADNGIVVSES